MSARADFQRALRERDVPLLRRASAALFPEFPLPESEEEAIAQMHIARTMQSWMTLEERAYSHHWLVDRGLPTMLPPELRPGADRYRPEISKSVGVSHATGKEWLKDASPLIVQAMTRTVENNQDLIDKDPELLKDKILYARSDEFRRLFGVSTSKEVER